VLALRALRRPFLALLYTLARTTQALAAQHACARRLLPVALPHTTWISLLAGISRCMAYIWRR